MQPVKCNSKRFIKAIALIIKLILHSFIVYQLISFYAGYAAIKDNAWEQLSIDDTVSSDVRSEEHDKDNEISL